MGCVLQALQLLARCCCRGAAELHCVSFANSARLAAAGAVHGRRTCQAVAGASDSRWYNALLLHAYCIMRALQAAVAPFSHGYEAAAPAAGVDMRRVMLTPKSIDEAFVLLVRPEAPVGDTHHMIASFWMDALGWAGRQLSLVSDCHDGMRRRLYLTLLSCLQAAAQAGRG